MDKIEERIETVTTYTTEEGIEMLENKNDHLTAKRSRRVPFPEFGMDIVDRKCAIHIALSIFS